MDSKQKIDYLKKKIKSYPDFPKPGILFWDIFSILNDPSAFKILNSLILEYVRSITPKVTCVAGLDSRGFLFGPMIALDLNVPFIPIRKKGKLPGVKESIEYTLEYGSETIEVQKDFIQKNARVLIVDDLLATGGTMAGACTLFSKLGATIVTCFAIMELVDLNGREKINTPVHSLIKL